MIEKVRIKRLTDSAVVPTKATSGSAAYDITIGERVTLRRGRNLIKLGFAMQLPHGYCAEIHPRSGYSLKGFAGVAKIDTDLIEADRFNADVIHGLIDEDYRGEVGVIVINNTEPFTILGGQRIAQMLIHRVDDTEMEEVGELDTTERADGGFNHTGI